LGGIFLRLAKLRVQMKGWLFSCRGGCGLMLNPIAVLAADR
jgi:hypothetical protein